MGDKRVIIIGAGPAGLTAAQELLARTGYHPLVLEATECIGGISRTVRHRGNRIDVGGHRFFSKSRRVNDWWLELMPLQGAPAADDLVTGRAVPLAEAEGGPDPERTDRVMLVRNRLSRIYSFRKFFDYPIALNRDTLSKLGWARMVRVGLSYLRARLFPVRPVRTLEDYYLNKFGRELYQAFFRDYTQKVWGVPCSQIGAEWGAQRVKGLSVAKVLAHAVKSLVSPNGSHEPHDKASSLITRFFYPKLGPGQLWELAADRVRALGGEVRLGQEVVGLELDAGRVKSVRVREAATGQESSLEGEHFISTMPVKDLVKAMGPAAPQPVREAAQGLIYRDFITVGLLVDSLLIPNRTGIKTVGGIIPDNWIYVQDSQVRLGRIQVFNNWSPYLVADPGKVWLGLEYFCTQGDDFWNLPDADLADLAAREVAAIGIIDLKAVRDSVVVRMPKAYPAYFGGYRRFPLIREFTDSIPNLFLVGRNGMHRYNNQDHSMLTAMTAVDNIAAGSTAKDNIWAVNIDDEYHESMGEPHDN